ncbi:MAG: hypothetical protein IPK59_06300 [Rhodospirillaceae bacterium]|nr:hypothetical protein [Rhodospirillaceae bacterium]
MNILATGPQPRFYRPDSRLRRPPILDNFEHAVRANRSVRIQGWYQSSLNAASFPFFSSLERKLMLQLDISEGVKSYQIQPKSIQYSISGVAASYTADALVHRYVGASYYIEVKALAHLHDPEVARKLAAVAEELASRNTPLRIVTDAYLATEPRQSNIRQLQLYRSVEPDLEHAYRVDTLLAQSATATIGTLAALTNDLAAGRESVYALLLRRHLVTNLLMPLGDHSVVRHTHHS